MEVMDTCYHCGANVLHTHCDFCEQPTPKEQLRWLHAHTLSFLRVNGARIRIHVREATPDIRVLKRIQALRLVSGTDQALSYEWTRYGRALAQELAA